MLTAGRKVVLTALALAALDYLLVCAVLYFYQERLIFYPEVTAADFEYAFPHAHEEVTLKVEEATIHALHFKVDSPRGAVLYLQAIQAASAVEGVSPRISSGTGTTFSYPLTEVMARAQAR